MADVVFLGLGQANGFDNKDIDQVIGQEVAIGRAEVVRTGKFGQIIPSALEPQTTFGDLPPGDKEVQFFGEVENVPPPTANPEVEFIVVPRESGEVVGPVFNVESPDVVLGPIGQSSNLLNQITPLGGFPLGDHLLPVQFDTEDVNLGIVGPLLPQSIDPATNLPPAGPYAPVFPFNVLVQVCIGQGTIQFLINTDPSRYKTDPFPPSEGSPATFAITDANNGIFPKRIRFLPDTNTPALRDFVSNITFVSIFTDTGGGNIVDILSLETSLPTDPNHLDRFLLEDAPIARVTPVIEVILG
jgi:hypothetical protein